MKSRRAVKVLIVLLALPIVGAVGVAVWINKVADRRWAAAQDRIHQLSATFPPPKPRPAEATSSETAKDIQAAFVSAIRLAAQRGALRQKMRMLFWSRSSTAPTAVDEALEDASDILARIHAGARRFVASPSDFPPSWRGEWDGATMEYIVDCCVLGCRRKRVLGKPTEAAEMVLDGIPLIRFWGESEAPTNRLLATQHLARLHDEMRALLSREKLPVDDLRRIDVELDLSDRWLQLPYREVEPYVARWAETLPTLQPDEQGYLRGAAYRWRYLLPVRLMKAEALEIMDHHARALIACEGQPYLEWLRCSDAARMDLFNSLNPILRPVALDLGSLGWHARERQAEMRLLRIAARYLATGKILSLEDPFGSAFLHSESPEIMTFWSLGPNGKDDSGNMKASGPWFGSSTVDDYRDIVIEVERRKQD